MINYNCVDVFRSTKAWFPCVLYIQVRSLLEVAGLAPEEQRAHMMQHWRQYELSAVCCRQNVFVPTKGKAAYVDALLVRSP